MIIFKDLKLILILIMMIVQVIVGQRDMAATGPNFSSGPSGYGLSSDGLRSSQRGHGRTGNSMSTFTPSSPSGSSGQGKTSRGRIVNNSILDPEEDDDHPILPVVGSPRVSNNVMQGRNRQQQRQQKQQQQQRRPGFLPSRQMTTGPTVGNSYNGMMNEMGEDAMENLPDSGNRDTGIDDGFSDPTGNRNSNSNTEEETGSDQDQQVHRFVSVHVAPPEPVLPQSARQSQSTPKPEVHYQIVFIKAPTPNPQELQEIQLPEPPQMKTMVYVLLKKPEMSDYVRIQQRPKSRPSKPEVFFIRYRDRKQQEQQSQLQNQSTSVSSSGRDSNMSNVDDLNSNVDTNENLNPLPQRNPPNSGGVMGRSQPNNNNNAMRPTNSVNNGMREDEMSEGAVGGGMSGSGGYESQSSESEMADSDFSNHEERYNENAFSLSSYQQQNRHRYNLGGYSYVPVTSQYGVVS